MDDVTLYTGDCAQVMRERIADGSIDLTVTSPPYDNLRTYRGFVFDFEAIAAQLWRVTKPGGVVVWVVGDATINGSETGTSFRQALYFMGLGFNLHDTMIYKSKKPPLTHRRYEQEFEYMFVFSKLNPFAFHPLMVRSTLAGRTRTETRNAASSKDNGSMRGHGGSWVTPESRMKGNVWDYQTGNCATEDDDVFSHPAPFPEALARDHIASWSNSGDLVLDPMMGSGTTGKMAVMAGRRFIGIDIAAEYVELARQRIGRTQLQPTLIPHVVPAYTQDTLLTDGG